jgi:polyhydroxyalkanoate synthesis regulator phasin
VATRDDVQKYLDAGIAFTNLTRTRAEELVGELVNSGVFQSGDAWAKVDELIERSRKGSEQLVTQVRAEVANQLRAKGITSLEDLAREVATMIGRSAEAGKAATSKPAAAGKTAAKKTAAKKAAAKSSVAQQGAAKKAAPKAAAKKTAPKAAAKKTSANKKTSAKQPAPGTSTAETAPSTRGAAADSRAPEPGASG